MEVSIDGRPGSAPRMGAARSKAVVAVVGAAWTAAVTLGFVTLFKYANTPGSATAAPRRWPHPPDLALDAEHHTLLLFAHPRCPCTRATIAELDRVMAASAGRLAVTVLFYTDDAFGTGWERSQLWEHAARIPGVRVERDPGGALAASFAARTSGAVVVYSPDGRLRFCGGITASRGHEGDNAGSDAILSLANGRDPVTETTPVYGCGLVGRSTAGT